jgi:hypothetical protein
MHRRRVPDSVLAAALSSCVVEPELLNSERIAERFGSYGIGVVDSVDGVRRSSLYSGDGDGRVCRTFAVVRIESFPDGLVDDEHDLVVAGGSIGAIFKAHGWRVFKETAHTGSLQLPATATTIPSLMRIEGDTSLGMHVYRLLLRRDEHTFRYATVVEVHHPDYLSLEDIERTYVVDTPSALSSDEFDRLQALVLLDN